MKKNKNGNNGHQEKKVRADVYGGEIERKEKRAKETRSANQNTKSRNRRRREHKSGIIKKKERENNIVRMTTTCRTDT